MRREWRGQRRGEATGHRSLSWRARSTVSRRRAVRTLSLGFRQATGSQSHHPRGRLTSGASELSRWRGGRAMPCVLSRKNSDSVSHRKEATCD
jgi:hypothetical protein